MARSRSSGTDYPARRRSGLRPEAGAPQTAKAAGADADAAIADAQKAQADAARAVSAAIKASAFAVEATNDAFTARDAANRAATDADAAATAADAAAASAGQATNAAQLATQYANAATAAAQASVTAANQAQTVFDAARQADADRLAISADQADENALAAAAAQRATAGQAQWDADQVTQRGAQVNQLLADAANPSTATATAVKDARTAAVTLATDGGPWTRAAALDAIAGDDDVALNFARSGVAYAAGQDDRETLENLAADGSDAMKAAAATALAGTDADVANFLQNPTYPGRITEERLQINQAMAAATAAGDTTVAAQAQTALDSNNEATYRDFLTNTRFVALATDERLQVNQILASASSGPQVKAAAQAALDGPPGYVHQFLTVDHYNAAQDDEDDAAHVAEVSALLSRASYAAAAATQAAYDGQAAAATARGAAADASGYAQQAQQSAAQAAQYAQQADQSADQAQASSLAAIASATAAANAAATAQQAAQSAGRSAVWAATAAKHASTSAAQAYQSGKSAYNAAMAASNDATLAIAAYNTAVSTANTAIQHEQNVMSERFCEENYVQNSAGWAECLSKADDSADQKLQEVYENTQTCTAFYTPDSPGYRTCMGMTLSPTFQTDLVNNITLAGLFEVMGFATAASAETRMLGVGALCVGSGVCGVLALIGGELAAPGTVLAFLESGGLTLTLGGLGAGAATAVGEYELSGTLADEWVSATADEAALSRLAQQFKGCTDCAGWEIVELPNAGGSGGYFGRIRYIIIDEQVGAMVQQSGEFTCWAACIEAITNGRLTQAELIAEYNDGPKVPGKVASYLGSDWKGGGFPLNDNDPTGEGLFRFFCKTSDGPWIAELGTGNSQHYIIIDGINSSGLVMVRDPGEGSSYTISVADFLSEWAFKIAVIKWPSE